MKHRDLIFTVLILLSSILRITYTLEVLIDLNFQKRKNCLQDIQNQVTYLAGYPYNQLCAMNCFNDSFDNSDPLSVLEIIQGLGAQFTFPLASYTEPYSYIQLDVSYVILSSANDLLMNINGLASKQIGISSTQSIYSDPSQIFCYRRQTVLYTTSLVLNQQISSGQNVVVQFDGTSSNMMTYLRSIKVSKNCTPNCSKCQSANSCSMCYDGYSLYSFDSGPSVCEQVGVCSTANCFSCAQYSGKEVCLKCSSGFNLNSSKQCDQNSPAPLSPCQANQYSFGGKCQPFSSIGYYQDRQTGSFKLINSAIVDVQKTYKCPQNSLAIVLKDNNYQNYQCRCMFANCTACSSIDTCDLCITGMEFSQSQMKCIKLTYSQNSYKVVQKVTETGYLLELIFDNNLVSQQLSQNNLNLTISSFNSFSYQLIGIQNNTIAINISCTENVKNKMFNLTITDSDFLAKNLITQPSVQGQLLTFVIVSQSEINSAKDLNKTGGKISKASMSIFIIMAIFGSFFALLSTVDFIGFVYFLFFLNIRYPINIQNFAEVLKNFQMGFFPNFFSGAVNSNYFQNSTLQFMQQQFDGYFLNTAGSIISFFIVIICVYLLIKIFSGIQLPNIQDYCKRVCYQTWEFGGILSAVWAIYIYVLGYVFIQFYKFDCSDNSCGFNYFWFGCWAFFCAAIPCVVFYLIKTNPNIKDDRYMRVKCSSLIAGLKLFSNKDSFLTREKDEENNTPPDTNNLFPNLTQSKSSVQEEEKGWRAQMVRRFSRYNIVLLYFRKIAFLLIIVYLYKYTYAQIAIISVMNVVVALFYLLIQPYEKKYENYKNAAFEIVMIVIQILFAFLVKDSQSQSEANRILIGWIGIALVCIVILWSFISMSVEVLYELFLYLKSLKSRRNRSKVANFDAAEHGQENNHDISPSNEAKKRTTILQKLENQQFQNVKEEPIEDEEENGLPVQSQRLKRAKFSQIQLRKESSVNNLETFVDHTNASPEVSPKRKRVSRLSITNFIPQPTQVSNVQQNENAGESAYDIPNSNYQIINPETQKSPIGTNSQTPSKGRFNKIKAILES
ncbi:hypothetical protein TTHERM_00821960 (macronuclear) [Tetrahymena thermophila SB210]|uniref:Transmembrane protein n=1 Tax=Tetrahymena thermophila (strain SB210) TaxID=312017 RepID=Q22F13_TETTS|nr:hypothetical protein TTHERM_00821960 [Tetrahymena thermophila SB210]EAR83862.2 hypothetical protein TTHERM_00821960 [Tetrahymena thermophila SB210]|eukprot:XP_001031525.2 hypothetical protein TTHERM_00821960 [Tetrahymena thermophila SB210]